MSFTTKTRARGGHPGFKGRRIGVVWTGKSSQRRNPFRSIPLAQLAATLHGLGPCQLYSLYKGEHERDIAALPVHTPVTNLSPEIKDFADSAAVLSQLDLLVTTCTSLAHLAGAMGITTHLLLDSDPFWVCLGSARSYFFLVPQHPSLPPISPWRLGKSLEFIGNRLA